MTDSNRILPPRAPDLMAQEVGDEIVVVAGDRAIALSGGPADAYREGGMSRRHILKLAASGVAMAGVVSIILPMADAAASLTAGNQAITLSPTSGPLGTLVTVAGTNFFPSGSITSVTIGGITVTPSSTVIDGSGNASFTFVVPNSAAVGIDTVSVTDNHNNTATKPFTVTTPTLTLNPTSGPSGRVVQLSGTGFGPSSATLTAKFDATTVAITGSTGTSSGGAINGTPTITVPISQTVGAHTVTVTDSFGNIGTATYTVAAPTVTLSRTAFPRNGSPSSFTVTSSSGFLPGSTITVTNSALYTISPTTVVATAGGAVPTGQTFTVTYLNGSHSGNITFTDGSGNTVSVASTA